MERDGALLFASAGVLLLGLVAPAGAAGTALAPHRAVYDLTLLRSSGLKAPTGAHGQIKYDFSGSSCEGYVANFRQMVELDPPEGPQRLTDMRSATFEDGEGRSFRFQIDTRIDGELSENIDGSVARTSDGALTVKLQRPKTTRFDLASGILFPTEHIKHILIAAKAQESTLEARVFDGSETGEKVYDTLTVIGHPLDSPAAEQAAQNEALKGVLRWPVAISYFDPEKKDGTPSYVMSFDLYENGIARALKIDYGDFILAGEMTSLEILHMPGCN